MTQVIAASAQRPALRACVLSLARGIDAAV